MAIIPQQTQFERQHEQAWELPWQCCRRKFFPAPETRTDQTADDLTRDAARQGVFDYIEPGTYHWVRNTAPLYSDAAEVVADKATSSDSGQKKINSGGTYQLSFGNLAAGY